MRDAAASAIRSLGYEAVRSEDFTASPDSARSRCLQAVRQADAMVLILGSEYGSVQDSGLSATHEEYREARDSGAVLAFVEGGVESDSKQREFISEVQNWDQGQYTSSFSDAADLEGKVTLSLHKFALAKATTAPLDEEALAVRSKELIPNLPSGLGALLAVSVASGPSRQVLSAVELADDDLHCFLRAEALTGNYSVLRPEVGTRFSTGGDTLTLGQDGGALVCLDEAGRMLVVQRIHDDNAWNRGVPALIVETVGEQIARSMRLTDRILEHVDQPKRLSHIVVTAALLRASHLAWRTKEEQERDPLWSKMGSGHQNRIVVQLPSPVQRRAALTQDVDATAKELAVRLRREAQS